MTKFGKIGFLAVVLLLPVLFCRLPFFVGIGAAGLITLILFQLLLLTPFQRLLPEKDVGWFRVGFLGLAGGTASLVWIISLFAAGFLIPFQDTFLAFTALFISFGLMIWAATALVKMIE